MDNSQSPNHTNHDPSAFDRFPDDLLQIRGKYSPLQRLVLLIGIIATAEIIAMVVVYFNQELPYYLIAILDTAIMILIILPLLYIISIKPLLQQIQQREQSEQILQARLRLMHYENTHPLRELMELSLNEVETLTGSQISFFHFLDADQLTISLQAWSTNTLQVMCTAEGKDSHYDLDKAGVWADAVRQRKPIVHNDYPSMVDRRGLPEGHARIIRELVVPILREEKVVAILGVGNKAQDYSPDDIELVSTFADFAWDIIEHKRAENEILLSEEKFHTLLDWTYDWEMWIDMQGKIGYISPACERISGYTPQEFIADPKLVLRIVHPDDQPTMEDHQKVNHEANAETITLEYRIISRDGGEHWIEHICRPLFSSDNTHLGRRISNRDITRRKNAEQTVLEKSQKELELIQANRNLQMDIGRDLHDTLGNHISFLRMNLEYLAESQSTDPVYIKTQIQNMTKVANEAYEMIRAMLVVLQTENMDEPISLFTRYAEKITERSSFSAVITSSGQPRQLSLYQIRQLFYIFREALGNIEKHARARSVSVEFIWNNAEVKMVVSDDGVGFDPEIIIQSGHYGLKFMRERTEQMRGSFYIRSVQGRGTSITVLVPYETQSIPAPAG